MGVDYHQYCMIGIKIPVEDLKVVTSPAVYEDQNRYDSKTGKVKGTERVLVKDEEYHYEWDGKVYEEPYDLGEIEYDDPVETYHLDDYLYFGYMIDEDEDYGRVNLLEGELTLELIQERFDLISKKFPDYPVKMYFMSRVG